MIFLPFERFSATFYIFFSSFCKFRQGKNLTNPSQIRYLQEDWTYLLSDSCSNKESDTREFGLSHSCAAPQLAVGFGWSVPRRGTYGETGGLLIPTAALLRSLQWVSDSRSRVAEHRGCDGRWLCHV